MKFLDWKPLNEVGGKNPQQLMENMSFHSMKSIKWAYLNWEGLFLVINFYMSADPLFS